MAGNAAAIAGVDEVESRLGLGAAAHIGLCEHELKVGTDCVGEGEGCEPADVGFGSAQFGGVCWGWDDGVPVAVGVGSGVGIQNVIGAGCNHPGGVEVAAESCEGYFGGKWSA